MARKILVVDDEKPIVELISFNLRKEGHEVIEAGDGSVSGLSENQNAEQYFRALYHANWLCEKC